MPGFEPGVKVLQTSALSTWLHRRVVILIKMLNISQEAKTDNEIVEQNCVPITLKDRLRDKLSTIIVFIIIYITLLTVYRPDLIFNLTTVAGGDMGSHNYIAKFLIEELLPRFRITGWTQGWFAGMPMLTFYFPLTFLLIALLNTILPYVWAFKFVTMAGVFLLPLAAYLLGRLFRFRPPFPEMAAVFATSFLFMESFTIYGGNILSTLAGEFSFSLSFALMLIFLGTLHRGIERGKFDWLFIVNALILTAIVLSHLLTTIILILIVPSFLLIHRRWRTLGYIAGVFLLAFFLTAFWGLPFVDKIAWTPHLTWKKLHSIKDLLPLEIRPFLALGLIGVIASIRRREKDIVPIIWAVIGTSALFFLLPDGRMWNARMLPFFFISIYLLAARGVSELLRTFTVLFEDVLFLPKRFSHRFYVPIIAAIISIIIWIGVPKSAGWAAGNYVGFESKSSWGQYQEINNFIDSLEPGRVMFEHDHDRIGPFGTTRAFELLPYWTKQPSMEGLLAESSFTAPFHFINQAELSVKPGSGVAGLKYPPRNTALGLIHLQMMSVPYLITSSPEVISEVMSDPRANLLKTVGSFSIFKISGNMGYVEIMKNYPVRISTDDWFDTIKPWYMKESALKVLILWDNGDPALNEFKKITADEVTSPPVDPIGVDGHVTIEKFENEKLIFTTPAVGKPHLIKISYFPNWRAEGADGPFVVSPSFMMVIPRQSTVTLIYGSTLSDKIGVALTSTGWLIVVVLLSFNIRKRRVLSNKKDGGRE